MLQTDFQYNINQKYQKDYTLKKEGPSEDACFKDTSVGKNLLSYQKLINELINKENFRGLLLYFGLGSGKTYTALNVAENTNKKVIIICPALIKEVFIAEIYKFFGDKYKNITDVNNKFQFISYNAPNVISQYNKLSFDDKKENIKDFIGDMYSNHFNDSLIIIDEAHTFFQMIISSKAKQSFDLFNIMQNAVNSKFLFLTGTPLIGNPFELWPVW